MNQEKEYLHTKKECLRSIVLGREENDIEEVVCMNKDELTKHTDFFGERVFPRVAFPPSCTVEQIHQVVFWGKEHYNGSIVLDEGIEGWLVFTVRCKPHYFDTLQKAAEAIGGRVIGEDVPTEEDEEE